MKDPEDEEFERIERESGWRKRQVEKEVMNEEILRELWDKSGGDIYKYADLVTEYEKQWIGLSGEEKYKLYCSPMPLMALIEEIEYKLKEKNK